MADGLGERGERLWKAYSEAVDGLRGQVLLEEACRTADRLDRLDAILSGEVETWARLTHSLRTEDYELVIDGALAEARQQANLLRQLIASLPLKETDDPDGGEAWLDGM